MLGGTLYIKGKEVSDRRFKNSFMEEERGRISTYRELRGMEEGLLILGSDLRGTRVQWGNGIRAACKAVGLGSMKKDCMEIALRIAKILEKYDLELQVVLKRRNTEEIMLCDWLSKDVREVL